MALPFNTTPTYNVTIPSTQENIKYRPFLVKEEKALLIAQHSEDQVVMIDTLKNIIKSCTLDKINPDTLATFDIEYLFTQIRAKSVGENVDLLFPCDIDHGEDNEKAKVKITFDLTKINVEIPEGHNKKIELFDDVGVIMKYPSINIIKQLENVSIDDIEAVFNIISSSIDIIYNGSEMFHTKEQNKKDVVEFLENLTSNQFSKIQKFFDTMPRLRQSVKYTCPVCSREHDKVLEGLDSFF
jgi:hypothetical protein